MQKLKNYLALIFLLPLHAFSQDVAIVKKTVNLLESSNSSAATVLSLSNDTQVEVMGRKGLWTNVKFGDTTGWVKVTSLKFTQTKQTATSLGDLTTGRSGAGNGVAVTGVRGLDAEEISLAEPSLSELEKFLAIRGSTELFNSFQSNDRPSLPALAFIPQKTYIDEAPASDESSESVQDSPSRRLRNSRKRSDDF